MNQEWLNQLQAATEHAQQALLWFWIVLAVVEVAALAVMAYFFYWVVQLMKAAIRALDRWNPGGRGGRTEPPPVVPTVSTDLAEAFKYGPKPK